MALGHACSQEHSLTNDPIAAYYIGALEKGGKSMLAIAIMKEEGQGPKTPLRKEMQNPEHRMALHREMIAIRAAIDIDLLKAITQGQVSRKADIVERPVWTAMKYTNDPNLIQPSIYVNSICDGVFGISPTPEQ